VSAASSIATCTDVQISEGTAPLTTTTSNAPVLYWNTTSTKTTSGGLEAKILAINNNDFADVVINTSGLANNQMLQYNTTGTKWVNWNPSYLNSINSLTGTSNNLQLPLDSLSNVSTSSKASGQVLTWNATSSAWTPTTVSTTAITMEALTDVNIANSSSYLAVAGTNGIYITNDLSTYTLYSSTSNYSTNQINSLIYANNANMYMILDQNGGTDNTYKIFTSTDCKSWTNTATLTRSSNFYARILY